MAEDKAYTDSCKSGVEAAHFHMRNKSYAYEPAMVDCLPYVMNMNQRGKKMYLISLYFDSQSEDILQKHILRVAAKTGNTYMQEHKIPPHLTIGVCRSSLEEELVPALDECAGTWRAGPVDWVAVGSFKPHVLFLAPVLNQYLHGLCMSVNAVTERLGDRGEEDRYRPFGWMPHTAIARTLTEKQMLAGFHVLQTNFSPFSGKGIKIGLARSNPYQNIKIWDFPE